MSREYHFVFQWGDKTGPSTVIGNNEHDVLRAAARQFFPSLSNKPGGMPEAIQLIKGAGGHVVKRRIKVT